MNRPARNFRLGSILIALLLAAACGDDNKNSVAPSAMMPPPDTATSSGSSSAPASFDGRRGLAPVSMPTGAPTAPVAYAGQQSSCTAPATGQHWNQIRNRPRSGGVGQIRNRIEATFNGTDDFTRAGVCEVARQTLGDSGPWCGTTGHTADWEAAYAMLDQLESCRGTSTQQDPPTPQQQQAALAINGWTCPEQDYPRVRGSGGITVVSASGRRDIRVPENGGTWYPANCHSDPWEWELNHLPDGEHYNEEVFTGPDGAKWFTVQWHNAVSVGLSYGTSTTGDADDSRYTGDRSTPYQTFRGEQWRVIIVDDDRPIPASFDCGNGFTVSTTQRGFRDIVITENSGPWTYANCSGGSTAALGAATNRFDIGGVKALGVKLQENTGIAFEYNTAINDNTYTGNRYSQYETIEGERWRVVIVEDDAPAAARAWMSWGGATGAYAGPRAKTHSITEGDNLHGLHVVLERTTAGPVCLDLSGVASDFRFAVNGADRDNCIQVTDPHPDRPADVFHRPVQVFGSHNDDNIVSRRQSPYSISIDASKGGLTGVGDSHSSLDIVVADDDVVRIRPRHTSGVQFEMDTYGATDRTRYQVRAVFRGAGVRLDRKDGMGVASTLYGDTANPTHNFDIVHLPPRSDVEKSRYAWTFDGARNFGERPATEVGGKTISLECSRGSATATFSISNHGGLGDAAFDIVNPVVNLCR